VNLSPIGDGSKYEGASMTAIAAWASLILLVQPAVVLVEESDRLNPTVLEDLYGSAYTLQWLVLDPRQFGWVGKRSRFWGVLLHKHFVSSILADLAPTIAMFQRMVSATWRILLTATREEVEAELEWASGRPGSMSHASADSQCIPDEYRDNAFFRSLIEAEQKTVAYCIRRQPNCISMSNQNYAAGWTIMTSPTYLHTLLHSPSINWIHGIRGCTVGDSFLRERTQPCDRWLTASEHLLAMGFPIDPCLSKGVKCFSITSTEDVLARKRQHIVGWAGNSMNVCVVHSMLAYILACIDTVSD
jgi:site-specific DNA-cytosine methylase